MVPYLLSYILSFLLEKTPQLEIYNESSYLILFVSHSLSIFIYFRFNKLFRKILVGYFRSFRLVFVNCLKLFKRNSHCKINFFKLFACFKAT